MFGRGGLQTSPYRRRRAVARDVSLWQIQPSFRHAFKAIDKPSVRARPFTPANCPPEQLEEQAPARRRRWMTTGYRLLTPEARWLTSAQCLVTH